MIYHHHLRTPNNTQHLNRTPNTTREDPTIGDGHLAGFVDPALSGHLLIFKLSAWKDAMAAMAKRREQCHESHGKKAPMAKRCPGKMSWGHTSQRIPLEVRPFLLNKKTCLPVKQEDMSSCSTRRHVFLVNKKTCLLVQREDMPSCLT